jgi:EAL domain-containing protein (putative c-di-GMP-specific phosphodiesterase class I)
MTTPGAQTPAVSLAPTDGPRRVGIRVARRVSARAWPTARSERRILAVAAFLVLVASGLAWLGGPTALLFDNVQEAVASAGAAMSLAAASRGRDGPARRLLATLAISLGGATLGMFAWDLSSVGPDGLSRAGDILFVGSVALGVIAIVPAIFGELERGLLVGVATDALILFLAGIALAAAISSGSANGVLRPASIGSVLLAATTAACAFALIARRIRPGWGGPWTLLLGASALGVSWLIWIGDAAAPSTVGPSDFLFSVGMLLIAYGGVTWTTRASHSDTYERIAPMLAAVLPVVAILGSLTIAAVYHGGAVRDLVGLATAAVIVTAVGRQVHLYVREATALEAERRAGLGLAAEIHERASTLFSLQRLTPGTSLEETAREVCKEALQLEGIDLAVIRSYRPDGTVIPLAVEGLGSRAAALSGHPLRPAHAALVRSRARDGPWEWSWGEIESPYHETLRDLGVHRTVNAPLRWNDTIIGDIDLGTCSAGSAVSLHDRLSTVEEFAVVASALLGPAIAERDHADAVRRTIRSILESRSFHPVFQPILELESRRVVGFEALTRFDSGQRPDRCFADAWSVGLGPELELAALAAAVDAAQGLAPGVFLDLNASPRLLAHADRLAAILETADRPLVLEITEHEVIEDYEGLRAAIRTLGRDVRVAVDDAGAGAANFGHIIDLRPDFVKLDVSLVRRVNANLGRQAMVVGMRHFSRTAGCRLIAEGVETSEEADTLTSLGVEFAQGFLFGRPEPIETWVAPVH